MWCEQVVALNRRGIVDALIKQAGMVGGLIVMVAISMLISGCSSTPTPTEKLEAEGAEAQRKNLEQSIDERNAAFEAFQAGQKGTGESNLPSAAAGAASEGPPSSYQPSAGPIELELLWKVPNEPVIAYHLHYGVDPKNLTEYLRIPLEQLEKLSHPIYGTVYRYKIRGSLPHQDIYVSIRAENEHGLSEHSKEIRVPVYHEAGVDSRGTTVQDGE